MLNARTTAVTNAGLSPTRSTLEVADEVQRLSPDHLDPKLRSIPTAVDDSAVFGHSPTPLRTTIHPRNSAASTIGAWVGTLAGAALMACLAPVVAFAQDGPSPIKPPTDTPLVKGKKVDVPYELSRIGSSDFRIREPARRALIAQGESTLLNPRLLDALKSTDLETKLGAEFVRNKIITSTIDRAVQCVIDQLMKDTGVANSKSILEVLRKSDPVFDEHMRVYRELQKKTSVAYDSPQFAKLVDEKVAAALKASLNTRADLIRAHQEKRLIDAGFSVEKHSDRDIDAWNHLFPQKMVVSDQNRKLYVVTFTEKIRVESYDEDIKTARAGDFKLLQNTRPFKIDAALVRAALKTKIPLEMLTMTSDRELERIHFLVHFSAEAGSTHEITYDFQSVSIYCDRRFLDQARSLWTMVGDVLFDPASVFLPE